VTRGDAKLRYRSPALPADVEETAEGFRLRFDEPAYGVAPGQTAVVYENDAVVASGTIASSAP
jgi:tRNA-specific 2-thiouridylase